MNNTDPNGETPVYNPRGGYFTYVLNPNPVKLTNGYAGSSQQCASGCQYLSGAPRVRYWDQGAAVSSATTPGTVIARGWIAGRYPNFGSVAELNEYVSQHPGVGNVPLNHAAIFIGFDSHGNLLVLEQWSGHPLATNERPPPGAYFEVDVSTRNEVEHGGSGADGRGAGSFFDHGGLLFGRNANGGGVYNSGTGWLPIGSASTDIRWNPYSGTGNYQASKTAEAYAATGVGLGSSGEGSHPVGPELE